LSIVYRARNKKTNKFYVGQYSGTLDARIKMHYWDCQRRDENGKLTHHHKMAKALRKYAKKDWEWTLLEVGLTTAEADKYEIHYIANYNSYFDGFNSTTGGKRGYTESVETKAKKSKSARKPKEDTSNFRTKQEETTKQKIGKANQKWITIDGVTYPSVGGAAKELDVDVSTIYYWEKAGTREIIRPSRKVRVDGIVYDTPAKAAKAIGVDKASVTYWLKTGKAIKA